MAVLWLEMEDLNVDKLELKEKIKSGKYDQVKLLAWVECLPSTTTKVKPATNKIGDVFMHPIFGHPYVLLKNIEDSWICTLLTSESTCPEVLEECKSRFFPFSYITKALFTASSLQGSFMGVFDNKSQLTKVHKQLKEIFS